MLEKCKYAAVLQQKTQPHTYVYIHSIFLNHIFSFSTYPESIFLMGFRLRCDCSPSCLNPNQDLKGSAEQSTQKAGG